MSSKTNDLCRLNATLSSTAANPSSPPTSSTSSRVSSTNATRTIVLRSTYPLATRICSNALFLSSFSNLSNKPTIGSSTSLSISSCGFLASFLPVNRSHNLALLFLVPPILANPSKNGARTSVAGLLMPSWIGFGGSGAWAVEGRQRKR